jgi:F0F1-type ATP synthase epsilon subunit
MDLKDLENQLQTIKEAEKNGGIIDIKEEAVQVLAMCNEIKAEIVKDFTKEKAIKLVKDIRTRRDYVAEKGRFCREHKFDLDAIKFAAIEAELRDVTYMIQDAFETGYVPHD